MSIASRAVGAALAALPVLVCTGAAAHAGHTGPDLLDGHVHLQVIEFLLQPDHLLALLALGLGLGVLVRPSDPAAGRSSILPRRALWRRGLALAAALAGVLLLVAA